VRAAEGRRSTARTDVARSSGRPLSVSRSTAVRRSERAPASSTALVRVSTATGAPNDASSSDVTVPSVVKSIRRGR